MSWSHRQLELKEHSHSRLGQSGQEQHIHNLSQPQHSTFSSQLKAFIPVVVVLVNV